MNGKYAPLQQILTKSARKGELELQLRMLDIDQAVGGLPPSARRYREWWSNGGQPHSVAWLDAGWRVQGVDFGSEVVRFGRIGQAVAQAEPPRQLLPPATSPPVVPRSPRVGIDPNSLPVVGGLAVEVVASWREVGLIAFDGAGDLVFPKLPSQPGIYRMTLRGVPGQDQDAIYIGETDDLQRRTQHYRSPGPTQETNIRLNAVLKKQIQSGGQARLSIIVEARLAPASGQPSLKLDLARKAARLLVESSALVLAQIEGGVRIENL